MPIQLPYKLPLPYSRERCREYEEVATAVRDQVFEAYERHLRCELHLNPSKWKLVKKRENVQIHYSRQKFPPSALHRPLEPTVASPEVREQADWVPMVKLVVMGTTLGTLEGAMTTSTTTARSNGFHKAMHNGEYERVGYAVFHSVELPDAAPLESQGILRSKYSATVLYRQLASGVVEVFNTTSLYPNGELMFKVTAYQAAEALIAVCKITESAMKKKLVWMQAARAFGGPNAAFNVQSPWQSRKHSFSERSTITCLQCTRNLSALRSLVYCEICATKVCSRCVTSHKLVLGHKMDELVYKSVTVCKGCIHTAQNMGNAAALAVYEFVHPFDRLRSAFHSGIVSPPHSATEELAKPVARLLSASEPEQERVDVVEVEFDRTSSHSDTTTSSEGLTAEKLRLWKQINELRVQAERTYLLSVRQSHEILQGHQL